MRFTALLLVILLTACYGELIPEQYFNCSSNNECPSGSHCGGIATASDCTGSGFGLPNDNPLVEGQWYFECNTRPPGGVRHYPYCVEEDSSRCDIGECDGVCVGNRDDAGTTVCVPEIDVLGACASPAECFDANEYCVFVLRFTDEGFAGDHECVWFPPD